MKKLGLFLLTLSMVAGMAGCATSSSSSAGKVVKDAELGKVNNCTFLGDVMGSAEMGSGDISTALEKAKNAAREKAGTLGATHIFWTSESRGYTSAVHGKAYLCK